VKIVLLPVELGQILLLVVPFLVFMVLLKSRFQFVGNAQEKMAGPPQIATEGSRKKLMEALGLPESVAPPDPLSKKELPLPERLPLVPQQLPLSKKSGGHTGPVPSLVEEKIASQARRRPPTSFQMFDQASLRHAIVAREVLGPPKALVEDS
jgi:hypothetical protein